MNSSGIKRGLAASAISALAVAGLPLLASSANAAVGDSFTVTYTGPALNGGDEGALVILRAKDGTITPADLDLTSTSSTVSGSQNTADQTANILGTSVSQDSSDAAYEFIKVRIATTTLTTGDSATFRIFEDDAATNGNLDAGEARQTVSISTAGPLSKIVVAPTSQSVPEGVESDDYTVTLQDSAGRTTQLNSTQSVSLSPDTPVTVTETGPETAAQDSTFTSDEIVRGTDTFTADPTTAVPGTYNIAVASGAVTATAKLVVTKAATLAPSDIDIVTAADSWDGPGDGTDGGTTLVRVDQNTIRIDIDAPDSEANSTVLMDLASTTPGKMVTFGGKDSTRLTTVLDSHGNGSIMINVDAGSIQAGDLFTLSANGFDQTIEFQRAAASAIDGESSTYFCKVAADCTVTAVVTDQFGNPVTTGFVEAARSGTNSDTTPQRKAVGSDGTVDFTFTDTKAKDGDTDTVTFTYFKDAYDSTGGPTDSSTTIKYTTTGQGSDYVISMDGDSTEAAGYKASDHDVIPLFDTVVNGVGAADVEDEAADISIANGETDQAVSLSVDNGALILAPGEDKLSEGSSSVDTAFTGTTLTGYRIIGTKSGLVTLTVTSAGRTETTQILVKGETDIESARNVTLTAPATVPHGTTQITFTAVVTDAFGNPVPGVTTDVFNKQVSGPGFYQDGDAQTDANGALKMNVRVDADATGNVTLSIDAADGYGQFGAAADRQHSYSTTDDGKTLSASADKASATTMVETAPVPPRLPRLNGRDNGAKADHLKVNADVSAAGKTAKLYKIKDGARKVIAKAVLDSNGDYRFTVADKNGNHRTKYIAKVGKVWTNKKSVR